MSSSGEDRRPHQKGSRDDDDDEDYEEEKYEGDVDDAQQTLDPEKETEDRAGDSPEAERADDVASEIADETLEGEATEEPETASGDGQAAAGGASGAADDATVEVGGDVSDGDAGAVEGGLEATPSETSDAVGDFAQNTFAEGAIDKRVRGDPGDLPAFPAEEPSHNNRVGSWDGFSTDRTVQQQPVGRGGWTASVMTEAEVELPDGSREVAYITNYDEDTAVMADPSRGDFGKVMQNQCDSQIALNAFTSAVGLKSPDVTYNEDRNFVAVRSVGDDIRTTDSLVGSDRAERVDRDEFVDMVATHLVAGNWDVTPDNIAVDADGGIHIYDFDRMEREWPDATGIKHKSLSKGAAAADKIDQNRPDSFDVSPDDIEQRAQEIAHELDSTGHIDTVADTIRSHLGEVYDNTHSRAPPNKYANRVEENVSLLASQYDEATSE